MFNQPLQDSTNAAFMTSLTDVIFRNQLSYKDFVLKTCKEYLMTVSVVMYFPKNFYLREAINEILNDLSSIGLLEYWIQNYSDTRFLTIQKEQIGPKKLEIHHLFGPFNIWIIGIIVSLIIFFVEILGSHFKKVFHFNELIVETEFI